MSETASVKSATRLPMGQALLKGKIFNRRKVTNSQGVYWLFVVKLPARDEFSHPSTVEIMSQNAFGEVGADWQGLVEVTGYPKAYNSKPDADTGEIKKIITADNRLRLIEE